MASSRLERLQLIIGLTDRLSAPLRRIQRLTNNVTRTMRHGFHDAAAGITALIAASRGFSSTAAPAIDMNNALGEVRSLGVGNDVLKDLNQSALQYSIQFGESAQNYVRSSYDIQSAIDGLSGKDLPRFTTSAGTLAKATKADVSDITDYFGTMYGIFRNQATRMGKANWVEQLAGKTATAVQKFKTTGPQMAAAFSTLGAQATTLRVGLSEQMAILGNLQSTMSGSEAGTKYRSYLNGIVNAESKLGLKFSDSEGRLLPVVDVLERIKGKYGDIDTLAKSGVLKQAFGSDEATGFLTALSDKVGKLKGDIRDLSNVGGMEKAQWMANQMLDPWARFRNGLIGVSTAIYQKALPAIEPYVNAVTAALSVIVSWTDKYPNLTRAIGLAAAALLVLVAMGGSLSLTIGVLKFGLGGLRGALIALSIVKFIAGGFGVLAGVLKAVITGTWAFNAALLANPITWVVLGIVGLIAALVALVVYWDDITAAVGRFTDYIVTTFLKWWGVFVKTMAAANPFALLGDSVDWIISKLNMIPGIDIDVNTPELPDTPKMPGVEQTITPRVAGGMPTNATLQLAQVARPAPGAQTLRDAENERRAVETRDLNDQRPALPQGGIMRSINTAINNNRGHTVDKLIVENHGEPMRGDQLMYELEMYS